MARSSPEVVADRALTGPADHPRPQGARRGHARRALQRSGRHHGAWAIGHGLEADLAGEGLSVYSGGIGNRVASDAITVIDDGSIPGLRGSMGYDDEGSPRKRPSSWTGHPENLSRGLHHGHEVRSP